MLMLRRVLCRFKIDMKYREEKAKLEIDPFDHPAFENEADKKNTGTTSQVEAWPRRKLKELYIHTLEFLKDIPEDSGYRIVIEELTRFRLKVVENHQDHSEIEKKIGYGQLEELIEAANNEIFLIGLMKSNL
jgi:ETC complex I subunit conserved region